MTERSNITGKFLNKSGKVFLWPKVDDISELWHKWTSCTNCLSHSMTTVVILSLSQLEWHLITRSPAVARIADCTGCQWPSGSSEVNDFHFIWKGICHFLLVINSTLGGISHCFQDMAIFPSKSAHFSYPRFIQPWILKCSPFTRALKFCMPRYKARGNIICVKSFPLRPNT